MIRHATVAEPGQEWLHADHLTGHDVRALLQRTRLRVASWSMFPTISKGDRIELDQVCDVTVGDIVVYRQCGALVCHRVKALGPDGLVVTASEAASIGTDTIIRRDIIGRVTSIIRGRRHLLPTHSLPPSLTTRLYWRLDQWHAYGQETTRTVVIAVVTAFKCRPIFQQFLSTLFLSCLRFHITARIPIESIPAHDMTRRSIWPRGMRRTRTLVQEIEPGSRLALHAHLGPYLVGSLDLRSREQRVHPLICGLGLEQYFSDLMQQRFVSRTDTSSNSS